MKIVTLLLLLFISSFVYTGNAQSTVPSSPSASNPIVDDSPAPSGTTDGINKPPPVTQAEGRSYLTTREFTITLLVCGLGLIALAMEFFMLRNLPELKAEDILRVFAVTLILFGTLFFIAAGFNSTQIAPALGLFGTVAGYLLGRSIDRKEDKGSD